MAKKISVIIPVMNEEGNVHSISEGLENTFRIIRHDYEIIFIDDGSTDNTLSEIKAEGERNNKIFYMSFSKNFGHQYALKAGLDESRGDCVICMDGDMQHPPTLLPQMIEKWEEGYDIVYTVRKDHKEVPMLKRSTSNLFYNILNRLSDIELESGTADFRLTDRNVVNVLRNFTELDLFWRGLIKWVGFKQVSIEYQPLERRVGESKYTLKKMISFALKGITSFSTKPLTIAIYLGFAFSLLSLLYIPYALISKYMGHVISGWASIIVTIAFFGGLQLMILGIIGTYLGKLFMQSKQRPHYIIKEKNL